MPLPCMPNTWQPATISIDILDVTGQVVERFERQGTRSVNEIEWPTSDVASGLYVIRVEVTEPVAQGTASPLSYVRAETKIMKVAVIR